MRNKAADYISGWKFKSPTINMLDLSNHFIVIQSYILKTVYFFTVKIFTNFTHFNAKMTMVGRNEKNGRKHADLWLKMLHGITSAN